MKLLPSPCSSIKYMSKNPIVNALAGLCYIALLVTVIFYGPTYVHIQDSIFIPIGMLSLFVFSAATMGYLFLYQPLRLFLEGEKKEAVQLFLKTLFAFAASAALLVLIGLTLTASLF